MSDSDRPLEGAWDVHVHAGPDVAPRKLDFTEAAAEAARARMAGIVFKDLTKSSVDRAYAATRRHPELRAYGGVVLDLPVGGINPYAVEATLRQGGRFVWMPVVHARHTTQLYAAGAIQLVVPPPATLGEGLSVFDPRGQLSRNTRDVVELVAEHDAVLCTGHLSPEESCALVEHAAAAGVARILVNHPLATSVGATIEVQRHLASLGAMLEYCFAHLTPGIDRLGIQDVVSAVATVGAEHCVLSSDLGQTFNVTPVAGMATFRAQLLAGSVPAEDVAAMLTSNPRRLVEGHSGRRAGV
jgi:hypothetical protein